MTGLIEYDRVKKIIRDKPYDLLQSDIYECVANICRVLQAYKQKKGERGWSSLIVSEDGRQVFSYTEQKKLEEGFAKGKDWLDILLFDESTLKEQRGGGLPIDLSPSESKFVVPLEPTGFDISLDKTFESFLQKTREQDDFWKKFAEEAPGFAKLLNTDLPGPYGIPIPVRPLVQLLITFLDSIRFSLSLSGHNSILITLFVMMEELVTGQWRQFLMTSAGLFSPTGTAIGVICKYLINAWMLINPDIRTDILTDIFKGGKSLFVGFLLWCVSTLPPRVVKLPLEQGLERVKGLVTGFDEKVKGLEQTGSEALKNYGLQLKFRGFDMDAITKISLSDIQNIQALAQWKVLACAKEYQELVDGLAQEPIFGLILELMNVPLTKDDRFKLCGTTVPQTIPETIAKGFEMQITPLQELKPSSLDEANNPIPVNNSTISTAEAKKVSSEENPLPHQSGGGRKTKTKKSTKPFFRKTRKKSKGKVKDFI